MRATGIRLYKLGSSHHDVGTFHRPQNIHSVLVRRVDCHERQTNPYLEDGGAIPSTTAARKRRQVLNDGSDSLVSAGAFLLLKAFTIFATYC